MSLFSQNSFLSSVVVASLLALGIVGCRSSQEGSEVATSIMITKQPADALLTVCGNVRNVGNTGFSDANDVVLTVNARQITLIGDNDNANKVISSVSTTAVPACVYTHKLPQAGVHGAVLSAETIYLFKVSDQIRPAIEISGTAMKITSRFGTRTRMSFTNGDVEIVWSNDIVKKFLDGLSVNKLVNAYFGGDAFPQMGVEGMFFGAKSSGLITWQP
jgi:hypothetical protein